MFGVCAKQHLFLLYGRLTLVFEDLTVLLLPSILVARVVTRAIEKPTWYGCFLLTANNQNGRWIKRVLANQK